MFSKRPVTKRYGVQWFVLVILVTGFLGPVLALGATANESKRLPISQTKQKAMDQIMASVANVAEIEELKGNSTTIDLLKELEQTTGKKATVLYLFTHENIINRVLIISKDNHINTASIDEALLNQRIELFRRALMPDLTSAQKLSSKDKAAFWQDNQEQLLKQSQWLHLFWASYVLMGQWM